MIELGVGVEAVAEPGMDPPGLTVPLLCEMLGVPHWAASEGGDKTISQMRTDAISSCLIKVVPDDQTACGADNPFDGSEATCHEDLPFESIMNNIGVETANFKYFKLCGGFFGADLAKGGYYYGPDHQNNPAMKEILYDNWLLILDVLPVGNCDVLIVSCP